MRTRKRNRSVTPLVIVMAVIALAAAAFAGVKTWESAAGPDSEMEAKLAAALGEGRVDEEEYGKMVDFFAALKKDPALIYQSKYEKLYIDNDFKFSEPQKKTAYLTFDDGPDESVTPAVLDVLKKYNVKATFFAIYNGSEEAGKLYKRIVDEGHTIAAHSYSHDYEKIYKSVDSFLEDFNLISEHI